MTTDANYNRRIADLTKEDRPREKALAKGLDALTTTELIAILLGSGTQGESVVDLAQRLLKRIRQQIVGAFKSVLSGI